MESGRAGTAASFGTTVFLCYFNKMPDPRRRGKVTYRLDEILLLALLATLAGAEGFTDIARFGRKKLSLFDAFRLSPTARRATTTRAIFSPHSTPKRSGAASWLGSAR
jgi:hypothetical protein